MASTLRVDDIELSGKAGLPIGFIYTQLPGSPAPDTLFTGTWSNVSSSYAGDFFRAEGGGDALAFSAGNLTEQLDQMQRITGEWPRMVSIVRPIRSDRDTDPSGAFKLGPASGSGPGGISTSLTGYPLNFDSAGSVSPTVARTGDTTRPINRTVRIWKRTA